MNCALAVWRFSRAPSPRTRFFIFFFVELFHGKVRHSFCGPEVSSSFPRPPPQAIDRERNTTRNQHRNGKPDLEAIDKLSMHFNTRRERKPTNFAQHRSQDRARGPRHRGRRGRVGGQERGRSVGESRGAEAARSALRCPPPKPLNLSSFRPSCRFSRHHCKVCSLGASGVSEEGTHLEDRHGGGGGG